MGIFFLFKFFLKDKDLLPLEIRIEIELCVQISGSSFFLYPNPYTFFSFPDFPLPVILLDY